jgi:hypothetical protein
MKILSIIFCIMFYNSAISQFVGTPYIAKQAPVVTLDAITPIYGTSATTTSFNSCKLTGKILFYGTLPLLDYGFYYGKSANSLTLAQASNLNLLDGSFSVTLNFTASDYSITLPKIYVMAYAKNGAGIVKNEQVDFASSENYYQVIPTIYSTSNKIWMDRNLGATSRATTNNLTGSDAINGYYYQWGRNSDGHQVLDPSVANQTTTQITSTTSTSTTKFVIGTSITSAFNRSFVTLNQEDALWTLPSKINNPCPKGFHVMSEIDLNNEGITNSSLAANLTNLKRLYFACNGRRRGTDGYVSVAQTIYGYYWTSTPTTGGYSKNMYFNTSSNQVSIPDVSSYNRATGSNVRCVKD